MPVPVTSRYRGLVAYEARGADGAVRASLPARLVPEQAAGATPYFHTVVAGETLESLAHRFLGSSEAWWQLADANPGVYPLALQPGSRLVVPTVADPGLVVRTRELLMAETTPFLEVKWEGQPITSSCVSVELEDNDVMIDKATITLLDARHTGPPFAAGQKVEVTMGWDGEKALLFSGLLRDPQSSLPASGQASITLIALDHSYLMNRETRNVLHPPGKLSALVGRVFAGYPTIAKGDVLCEPDVEFTGDPQVHQANVTDLQFLQRLAAVYGHRCFVEVNDGAVKYYFVSNERLLKAKPLGKLQYCRGLRQLIEFKYQKVASRAARQSVASGLDPATGEVVVAQGAAPPRVDPVTVDGNRAAELGCSDPADRGRYEAGVKAAAAAPPLPPTVNRPAGLPSHPGLARAVTIADPTQVLGLRGTGRAVGTIKLRAKGKVTIEGIPPWVEGDWYVQKAVHKWRDTSTREHRSASYETEFTVTR